jgi:hypothetical protein
MHVSIDASGEGEKIFGVEYFLGLICRDIGGDPSDLPVRDGDVAAIHQRLVRAHNPGIFDYEVEMILHTRFPLAICRYSDSSQSGAAQRGYPGGR